MAFPLAWSSVHASVIESDTERLILEVRDEFTLTDQRVGLGDTFHHAALPRMRGRMRATLEDRLEGDWASPLVAPFHFDADLGAQPYGFYPPLTIFVGSRAVLQMGPLTERSHRVSYDWTMAEDGANFRVLLRDSAANVSSSGMSERLWVRHWPVGEGPELGPGLFEEYNAALSEWVERRPAAPGLFWGTWNDGGFRNLSESRILGMADWLKSHVPSARWIQIDDGWAGASSAVSLGEDGLGMSHFGAFYRPDELLGDDRFAMGMRGLADRIREKGLRPMIWLTYAVGDHCPLFQEHPDWFLPDCRLHFVPSMRFMDPTVPEVRSYVSRALDLVFGEWGFEGCKLDFWTMPFEQPDALYRGNLSQVEAMAWFADEIRRRLPADGLFMHCIDLPFGSPFRSRWFSQFRFYSDSEGLGENPEMMREQAAWTAILTGLYGVQRFWQPDGDGLGIFDHGGMSDANFRRWCAMLVGSGTLTELAGYLFERPNTTRVQAVVRAAEFARPGIGVTLPGFDWDHGGAPSVWERADGVLALTNWTEEPLVFELGRLRSEVLSGEVIGPTAVVPPGDGMLFAAGE